MNKREANFIEKINSMYGGKIDTSKVKYVNNHTKVCLICHKKDKNGVEHGEYWQAPSSCLSGSMCPKCANESRSAYFADMMTTEKYKIEERKIHGDRYNLDKVEYKGANEKVCITCPKHGDFWQLPYVHLRGQGCPKCSGRGLSQSDIIERFREVHGDKYDYSKVVFTKMKDKVTIICKEHGEFKQTPQKHIKGQGCPKCNGRVKGETMENFILNANKVHGDKYGYSKVEYVDNQTKVKIVCPTHGEFIQRPSNHLQGCGCPKCSNVTSKGELEIVEFLKDYGCEQRNRAILDNREIDIYIPSHKVGIEFNGLHWHSEQYKNRKYHLDKLIECNKKGIRLIHIFEDEWTYKSDIVKSRLSDILGNVDNRIYARKCIIKDVSTKDARMFLDNNHIQGYCSAKYQYGLYYNDELVSLMTFGKLRKNLGNKSVDGEFELIRFCNKLNTSVVGGASKLFKHFIKNVNPKRVISYADRRWSNGKLYDVLGFDKVNESAPSYFYVINSKRENRYKYRKDVLVKEGYDTTKSEHEIMLERGIYRIYDCGCLVYEWTNNGY